MEQEVMFTGSKGREQRIWTHAELKGAQVVLEYSEIANITSCCTSSMKPNKFISILIGEA